MLGEAMTRTILTLGVCFGLMSCGEEIGMEGIADDRVLPEQVAVKLTKAALQRKGIDVKNLKPLPFWGTTTQVVARSDPVNDSGYVH